MSKIRHYESESITVSYDVVRCIHAEECVKRLRAVFDPDKRPWIQPQNAAADTLAETIAHCPSGALGYTRQDGGAAEAAPQANTVHLDANGPLYVRGVVRIGEETHYRVALCRCGGSKHKPFCDNAHRAMQFAADGLVAEDQRKFAEIAGGGELKITPNTNSSLLLEGDFEIFDAQGTSVFCGSKAWLCRCGGSSNKPFCDDTHKRNGFTAD
ncbi:MAG: CDGSH iron-sulfur domain-containing protein [Chloroflexi bacterium]|nr:CDGSH iron-sulfur domain-containing protein [Chloroflexota bacterium]